jgi:hypothetical protein
MKPFFALALTFLVNSPAFAQAFPNGQVPPNSAYMNQAAIELKGRDIVSTNYKRLSEVAFKKIQALMPACAFPAGNQGRIDQLKAIKLSDLKYAGSIVFVRNAELDPGTDSPNFISTEMYYTIPAGNGAPAITMGAAVNTSNLTSVPSYRTEKISGREVLSEEDMFVVDVNKFGNILLNGLKAGDARQDCNVSDSFIKDLPY